MSNEKISIEVKSIPVLKNPKLICGLPGSGYVGKLAIDYLIDKLDAKHFADIFSNSFPPQVSIKPDGTSDLVKNSLYSCHTENGDFIFLTGDAQPVSAHGEYALAEEILEFCKKINVSEIYTLAAFITGKFSQKPKVYGTSNSHETVKEFSKFGILKMDRGNITGMNGVLIGMAKKFSVLGTCVLGETSGYVIDAKASKAILESLCKMLNLKFDMLEIEKKAKDTDELIKTLQSQAGNQHLQDQAIPLQNPQDEKRLGYIS